MFFEFTNEKLYKQLVDKKKPGTAAGLQKATTQKHGGVKSKTEKKPTHELESQFKVIDNTANDMISNLNNNGDDDSLSNEEEEDFNYDANDDVEEQVQFGMNR